MVNMITLANIEFTCNMIHINFKVTVYHLSFSICSFVLLANWYIAMHLACAGVLDHYSIGGVIGGGQEARAMSLLSLPFDPHFFKLLILLLQN